MTSKIKVDNINKVSDDSNIINKCGTTITLGASGDSIALASGASQTGFGRTGTVNWQTGSIKTTTFTASDGEGYFVNTTSGGVTANLPAGSAGAIVAFKDYANTFDSNALTIVPNGSDKVGGVAGNYTAEVEGLSITLIFLDSTRGWIDIHESTQASSGSSLICASVSGSGNTLVTADTNFKVATFTGPGTFTVNSGGGPLARVDYMVVAGGGGGGTRYGGGGGAGGFRESKCSTTSGCWTASPRATCVSLSVVPGAIPITIGAGGAGSPTQTSGGNATLGTQGSTSTFSTISSAGGGGGSSENVNPGQPTVRNGGAGGSGGGASYNGCGPATTAQGGAGNTPSVSPAQGFAGGNGGPVSGYGAGGGGGATAVGTNGASPNTTGVGGAGATNTINGTPTARAGGGGGGGSQDGIPTGGAAGAGGGGAGGPSPNGLSGAGTANTGGGGGGGRGNPDSSPQTNPNGGGTGGSGIVIIRYKFQ